MKYAGWVRKTFSGKLRVGVKLGFADGNRYWPFGNLAFNILRATESTSAAVIQVGGLFCPHFGWKSLLARVESAAGSLRIWSVNPKGTAVRDVPISRSETRVWWWLRQ